ncbi:MAG: CoA transferase [Deltaproteobacteria bacterium]|nr:CoA transferase [Deltaproteobacteria bacterium]
MTGALNGIRVVECGDGVSAAYAGKLLADLGADVVKVESPAGDTARRRGPYPGGTPDPERSGLYLYLNTNKRGAVLDLASAEGRASLDALARRADLVVHNLPPADTAARGLAADALLAANPRLVVASITPYGLQGARRDWAATDLTLWNAGGIAYLNGGGFEAEDLPPLKPFGQQAEFQGGVNAAIAALGALRVARRDGSGQHVVVSIQQTLAAILELTFEYWPYQGLIASRLGRKPIQPLDFLECRDGWVFICCVEEHQWQEFVRMIGSPEWAEMELFADRLSRGANWDALKIFLQEWASEQSVMEVYHAAQQRRIPFAPVSTMGDLLASEHLKARGFFATLDLPGAPIRVPGAPYKLTATPWAIRRPAPRLGEHTAEVLREAGAA